MALKSKQRLCYFLPHLIVCAFFVRPLCVTLVFSTKGQRYLRVGLAMPLFGSVACLRRMVADEGKLSPDQVRESSNECSTNTGLFFQLVNPQLKQNS